MFGRNKNRPVTGRIDTLIAKQTVIDGDVSFQGGMHIEGRVRGSVRAMPDQKTTLWVGEGGRIDGDVVVTDLVVDGEIRGQVHATGRAVIGTKARVVGDLLSDSVMREQGMKAALRVAESQTHVLDAVWQRILSLLDDALMVRGAVR